MPKAPAKKSYVQTMIRREANGKLKVISAQLGIPKLELFDKIADFTLEEIKGFFNTKK